MSSDERQLVIPSEIPWEALKKRDLEECLYWLMDDRGARDLEWRQGGQGQGCADGGRDIEAVVYVPAANGEVETQRWWIEAKGRTGTVAAQRVKDALNNTLARSDIDVIVVATNTTFSNPTRNWVKEWQVTHQRVAYLWDREDLERMIVRHPSVVLRLFDKALSPQGRLEAISSRFWQKAQMPSRGDLRQIWENMQSLEFSLEALLALTAGELCNGDLADHPWLVHVRPENLAELLLLSMANLPHLRLRADYCGSNSEAISNAVAHILMMSLIRLPSKMVHRMVCNLREMIVPSETPEEVFAYVSSHIAERACDELFRICLADCGRLYGHPDVADHPTAERFWRRFCEARCDGSECDAGKGGDIFFLIEQEDAPCNAGLALDGRGKCPLSGSDHGIPTEESLAAVASLLRHRVRGIEQSESGESER